MDVADAVGPAEDVVHEQVGGALGASAGEQLDRREHQEVGDGVGDEDEGQRAAQQGQRDVHEALPRVRAVHGGGVVRLLRDVLEARDEEGHPVADTDPAHQHDQRVQRLRRAGQERLGGQSEASEERVERALGTVQDAEDHRGDGGRHRDGREDE